MFEVFLIFARMNYLAHIFLSGDNRKVQIGNFVGDAVKGRAYEKYPIDFRRGILLHRAIDDYTDHYPLVREAIELLRGEFGRYAGVMTDIYFDYFLAMGFKRYTGKSLWRFTLGFYVALVRNYRYLPERFKGFLWHFILTNRLVKYASLSGIRRSLEIMVEYKHLGVEPDRAIEFLVANRMQLQGIFERFLPDVWEMCHAKLNEDLIIN